MYNSLYFHSWLESKIYFETYAKMWITMDLNETKSLINQQFYHFKTTISILNAKTSCFYWICTVTFHRTIEWNFYKQSHEDDNVSNFYKNSNLSLSLYLTTDSLFQCCFMILGDKINKDAINLFLTRTEFRNTIITLILRFCHNVWNLYNILNY